MDALFSYFFKFRFFYFEQGEFTFQWISLLVPVLVTLLVAGAVLVIFYRKRWKDRQSLGWKLLVLRLALLGVLGFLIMRPSLVMSTLVPRENMVALLVDDSESMGIEDEFEPRGEPLKGLLSEDSAFVQSLEERFFIRPYLFDGQAEPSSLPLQAGWDGDQSSIVGAIERVLADSRNLPMGAIVVFSDGADNSYRSFTDVLSELKTRQIPVYTVGLGPEELRKDVELTGVSCPRILLPDSVAVARVTLQQQGFGGSRGQLEVRESGSLVAAREIHFPRDSATISTELTLNAKSEGIKTFEFTFQPLAGEKITRNNTRSTLIQVKDLLPRVLYVEGHPRWEYKFIRQALSRDKNLKLVTLLRTALNKFYRQGIEEETTLAAGFPTDAEDLFAYQGVILGSIESSFFTVAQMELLKEFVSKRGGGLMMIGGNSSFSTGRYRNTPIEQVLPVWLHSEGESSSNLYAQGLANVQLTAYGERHPTLSTPAEGKSMGEFWGEMPPLTDWNLVRDLKAGTTVLATVNQAGREIPLLAIQRFGRGQSAAFLTSSSWRWQMLRDSEDLTHETFWRQTLRWLISLAKDPVYVETDREAYAKNETVRVRAEVNDPSFNRINDATVEATVAGPDGRQTTFPLNWSASEDGVYEGEWTADVDGRSEITVTASRPGPEEAEGYGTARTSFLVATGAREFFNASQRKDFLQRLAEDTGGRYYSLDNVTYLPEEIVYTQKQSSMVEVLDLWDMPVNFLLLLALLLGEWGLRKRYGTI